MRIFFLALTLVFSSLSFMPAVQAQESEDEEISDVLDAKLSWVCLNPDTRRYQVVEAADQSGAQQAVDGDATTECKSVPAALDPERVARELNER